MLRRTFHCNFIDFAAPLTEVMLLGCLAQRAGKKIEWDTANMQATNWPQAEVFIKREYRKGWEIEIGKPKCLLCSRSGR